ncbi:MAG: formylglycine-generating enzyme family protein [Myxococcales bacterium]|nr:MAG: formylglycine-generating enzyme family protein [Myxococcales bacterium]
MFLAGCETASITGVHPTDGDDTPPGPCPAGLSCMPTSLGEAFCMTADSKFPVDASYCERDDDCPAPLVCPVDGHGPAWKVCLKICDPEAADGDLDNEYDEPLDGDGEQTEDGDVADSDASGGDQVEGETAEGDEPPASCQENSDCDDGNVCNGVETCGGNGLCRTGEAPNCDDGIDCTDDDCYSEQGCVHGPDNGLCDDENPGTVDVCIKGAGCLHGSAVKWVPIPAGTFQMGCVPQDSNCHDNESPRHEVLLSAFQMMKTEVTQAQFEAVAGYNPSRFSGCGPDCPVDTATWFDAKGFCEAVGGRLPTEAEWEYAARAWSEDIYICGNDSVCLNAVAWSYSDSDSMTHPVGLKVANAWGLHDMAGNVVEWTADWFGDYPAENVADPTGPADGEHRVLRGGSFGNSADGLRASGRGKVQPFGSGSFIGFRCARNLTAGE